MKLGLFLRRETNREVPHDGRQYNKIKSVRFLYHGTPPLIEPHGWRGAFSPACLPGGLLRQNNRFLDEDIFAILTNPYRHHELNPQRSPILLNRIWRQIFRLSLPSYSNDPTRSGE